MAPEYTDFRLTLEGDPTQGYVVTAHGPGDTYARAQVPHDLDAVGAVLACIEAGEAPTPGEMQEVEQRLHDLLFAGQVGRLFQESYAAQEAGTHLRLNLHLRTPELARLPWELAYDGQRFLAARLTHPIVRYVESKTPLKLPPLELPLRILYVQAAPRDRGELDLEASEEAIQEAVKGWAEVKVVRGAKPTDLLKALHQGEGYHILHFDGHGGILTVSRGSCSSRRMTGRRVSWTEHCWLTTWPGLRFAWWCSRRATVARHRASSASWRAIWRSRAKLWALCSVRV